MGKASREKKIRKMLPSIMAEIADETKVFGCGRGKGAGGLPFD